MNCETFTSLMRELYSTDIGAFARIVQRFSKATTKSIALLARCPAMICRLRFLVGCVKILDRNWESPHSTIVEQPVLTARRRNAMKAVSVVPSRREISLIQQEEPKLMTPSDVMLKMLDVGVCGTDKEIAAFQYGTPPAGSDYLAIGHESLGEVIDVGPAARTSALPETSPSAGSNRDIASCANLSWTMRNT